MILAALLVLSKRPSPPYPISEPIAAALPTKKERANLARSRLLPMLHAS